MTSKNLWYVLDESNNLQKADCKEWSSFFSKTDRRLIGSNKIGHYRVSTFFIGLHYCLFETVVLGVEENSELSDRHIYHDFMDAKKGHETICERVRSILGRSFK